MYSAFYNLEQYVTDKLVENNYSAALDSVRDFVVSMLHAQFSPGNINGSPKLDALCARIGASYSVFAEKDKKIESGFAARNDRVLFICTGLYRYGGTSLVIADLIKAHPGSECTVIATDYLNDMTEQDISAARIGDTSADLLTCPKGNAVSKLEWIIEQIDQLEPARIFLLNHHQDSVIIAAVQPFLKKTKVLFYHHADYSMCLGVHLEGVTHVDPHNVGYCNCREKELIRDNVYLPLVVRDKLSNRSGAIFIENDELITCSCATFHKFAAFYLYPYTSLIVDRLVVRSGIHIHVGNIPNGYLVSIKAELAQKGVDPQRFVHVPWVKDLWELLIEKKVDLFIASFPIGGARTTLEVMGAGIPILIAENYLTRFHSSRDIVYPNALTWKYPHQFLEALKAVSSEILKAHSIRSRAHYLAHYCFESSGIGDEINLICAGTPTFEPPPLYSYEPDNLDRALHFSHLEHSTRGAGASPASVLGNLRSSGVITRMARSTMKLIKRT
ncbi:hypothetical protein [Methylobacterium sp. Leaf125]|uniref:hypothetical protein n=1 Tax=Methylobacterium sp. Leaf125 TaxID=1736265 RepID=UPI000A5364A2|nr:hypothetical protein [Methylobacterium sp. Leaf125]